MKEIQNADTKSHCLPVPRAVACGSSVDKMTKELEKSPNFLASEMDSGQPSLKSGDEMVRKRKLEVSAVKNSITQPPPQRRKLVDGKPTLVTKAPSSKPSPPNISSPGPYHKSAPPIVKRVAREALNPRVLKGQAPASHDLRHRLLLALHGQFVRLNTELSKSEHKQKVELLLSEQDLITRALDLEESTATASPLIYSNLVKNKIMIYKRMNLKQWIEERENEVSEARKAIEDLSSHSSKGSGQSNEIPMPFNTGLCLEEELLLLPYLTTNLTELSKHGYVTAIPTDEEIEAARKGVQAAKGWEVCDRCKSRFEVFPERREKDGALTSGGQCTYHFGKAYFPESSVTNKIQTKQEKKFRCCGETVGDSSGCITAPCHVFKITEVKRLASILNFQKTPANSNHEKIKHAVCIDGEMGYTVYGLELIRLTATSWPEGQDLFDILVRPTGPILDLNSRFSGVYPEQMTTAIPWTSDMSNSPAASALPIVSSPAEARSVLFSHLSPLTPLIGHGLENDLNAVRIVHPTIIDTALLFPHSLGFPYRNSLKFLAQKYLNRSIQEVGNSSKAGHDSKEDANAAGELVKYAIKSRKEKLKKLLQAKKT